MPKTIYVDPNDDTGHDSNSGLGEKRAKRTLQGALALSPQPGDTIRVRMGTQLDGPQVVKTNGVTYETYSLGTEQAAAPLIRVPKVKDTPNGIGLTIRGHDNRVIGWDVRDADMGILVDAGEQRGSQYIGYTGNRLERVRVLNFAQAVMIRGSKTVCEDVSVFHGRMLRNTAVTYVGANGFTLWKSEFYPQTGTRLVRCYTEDCYAFTPASKKPDGTPVEIFGGVEDVEISWMVSRNSATFCEIGMTFARHETVRNVLFRHCLSINSNGRVLYVNDRNGVFGGDIEGIRFSECTFKADDDPASPFFIGEGHGDLSTKLRVEQCVVVAAAQIYNAAANTNWRSISRAENVYWRTDGQAAGVPLVNGDVFEDPHFHSAPSGDYRLSNGDPRGARLGALGTGPSLSEIYHPKPALVDAANATRGGHHSGPTWQSMVQTPERYRVPGMLFTVTTQRETYQLQSNGKTWLKVRHMPLDA